MNRDSLLLCPRWRKGDFRPVPVQPVITGQHWAGQDEVALSAPMERLAMPADRFVTARQLGALRHPNLGEGAA